AVTFYKNNATQGELVSGITDDVCFFVAGYNTCDAYFNFGSDSSFAGTETAQGNQDGNGKGDFYYEPPSGYLALCTDNLSAPEIALPGENFNTVLYTGNGGTQSITGAGFKPDVIWIKNREITENHFLASSLQDADGNKYLYANLTSSEGDRADGVTSIDSDGFSLGSWGNNNTVNDTHVSWLWKAGGTAVSNTDGTITSSVSANTTAGFSIVAYTGTGSLATVGHGLSVAPELVIIKNRTTAARRWSVGTTAGVDFTYVAYLDNANAFATDSAYFNDADPSATVFTINTNNYVNDSDDFIAYCFHSVEGYSKVGSYEGNGVDNGGPFVYTGFEPAMTLIKSIDQSRDWWIMDNKRDPYNDNGVQVLWPNDSSAEGDNYTNYDLDYLSNGFKVMGDNNKVNESGQTYLFYSVAASPFKTSNAR
ncbi:MAG: hypothetical protein QF535_02355, partial [Anaerolineales bacterium]|nr:hypothetical protein [Anaerolineales bacterium]